MKNEYDRSVIQRRDQDEKRALRLIAVCIIVVSMSVVLIEVVIYFIDQRMGDPDLIGLVAGTLVLLTFFMTSMFWLRVFAIASNIAFLSYGLLMGLLPIWLLHGILLPINATRLLQIIRPLSKNELMRFLQIVEATIPSSSRNWSASAPPEAGEPPLASPHRAASTAPCSRPRMYRRGRGTGEQVPFVGLRAWTTGSGFTCPLYRKGMVP